MENGSCGHLHEFPQSFDLPPGTVLQVKLVFQPAAGPDLVPGAQAVEATSVQGGWPEERVARLASVQEDQRVSVAELVRRGLEVQIAEYPTIDKGESDG